MAMENVSGLLAAAEELFNNQEFEAALEQYNKAIELAPDDASIYESRGFCHYHLANNTSAIADLERNLSLDPENHDAYYNLGLIKLEEEDLEGAEAALTKALEIYGDSFEYLTNYAHICMRLQKYDLVIDCGKRLLGFSADNRHGLEYLGLAHLEKEEYETAIEYYKRILRLDPRNPLPYHNIGSALSRMEDHQEAVRYFNTALNYDPEFAYSYNNRGFSKFHLGAYDDALEDVEQAIEIDPSNASAYKNRGLILKQTGKMEAAIQDFLKARELGYEKAFDEDVEAMLQEK